MKLLTFCSDSHVGLLRDFFMPSFYAHPEGFDSLVIARMEQVCPSATYKMPGWNEFFIARIRRIIDELDSAPDGDFIFLIDCDVQWFGPIDVLLDPAIDFQCQNDGAGGLCPGFSIIKVGYLMKKFWRCVQLHATASGRDDQFSINDLIHHFPLKVQMFNRNRVWTTRAIWEPDEPIPTLPNEILVHHANWVVSVENKVRILTAVRNAVLNR